MSPQNPAIDPRRTALLIMDYQPAVLGGLSDHDQLLTLASGAIDSPARHFRSLTRARTTMNVHSPMALR